MTQPADDFDDFTGGGGGADEQFETRAHQDHLLIVKLWDEVAPVITERCPTGYVTRNGREWPNNALRASIVDLDMDADDGTRGRVYPTAMIFAGLLVAELKRQVGKTLLLIWRQKDPSDKSSPYSVWNMRSDDNAVALGRQWLADHPEFKSIPAPPPWTNTPPARQENRDNGRQDYEDRRRYEHEYVGDRRTNGYDSADRFSDRERPRDDRQRDPMPRYDRNYDPRYDDRGRQERSAPPRRDPYERDPYADRGRGDSFMNRSAESQRRYQDEEPPF